MIRPGDCREGVRELPALDGFLVGVEGVLVLVGCLGAGRGLAAGLVGWVGLGGGAAFRLGVGLLGLLAGGGLAAGLDRDGGVAFLDGAAFLGGVALLGLLAGGAAFGCLGVADRPALPEDFC
ncbi:MAG: hypothetical protein CMJ32_10110 [Phycisphaerae bacterium]|nr:hypothetical protein [Phycisphaerae bacterium]